MILHPLAQALVLAIVLSQLLGARLSGIDSEYAYAIYLLSGTCAWNLFNDATSSTISMFKERANLLKKINFPRVCIPLIVMGTALVNQLILMAITILIVWALGITPSRPVLLLPLLVVINLGLAMGIGLILSVFDVFLRDISHLWQVVIQFWFWLTPIVYVFDSLPPVVRVAMQYNPMYWLVNAYQQVISFGQITDLQPLLVVAAVVLVLLVMGFFLFIRASTDIVDAL